MAPLDNMLPERSCGPISLTQFTRKCLSRKHEILEPREVTARKCLMKLNLSYEYCQSRLTCREATASYRNSVHYAKTSHDQDPSDPGYAVYIDEAKDRYLSYKLTM